MRKVFVTDRPMSDFIIIASQTCETELDICLTDISNKLPKNYIAALSDMSHVLQCSYMIPSEQLTRNNVL